MTFFFCGTLLLSSFWTYKPWSQVPSFSYPPRLLPSFFSAQRVQHTLIVDFSSSVVYSRSRAFRMSISAQDDKLYEYALGGIRTHEADLYQARGYNLICHRGSEGCRAGRPGGLVGLHSNTTTINTSVGP